MVFCCHTYTFFCDWSKELPVSAPGFCLQPGGLGLFVHSALSPLTSVTFQWNQGFSPQGSKCCQRTSKSEREIAPWNKSEQGSGHSEKWQGKRWHCHFGRRSCPDLVPTFPGLTEATKLSPTLQLTMSSVHGYLLY